MPFENLVIGVDYGTDSVRALIVDADSGDEISQAVYAFPRWAEKKYCDPANNQFRQHPLDHLEGMESVIREALSKAPAGTNQKIKGISIDTTGSSPLPVNKEGIALSLFPEFADNPNAMVILWKDHTAIREAEEINQKARNWGGEDYTKYVGGVYSSEWFWAKILHIIRTDAKVKEHAFSWMEHCDWLTSVLTGNRNPVELKRSRCAAGHKAMWHKEFGGLPPVDFFAALDPALKTLYANLYQETHTSDQIAGHLSEEWAGRLGLNKNTVVGVAGFDAHMGAVGGGIEPYVLTKIMGTSTCDILIAPSEEMKDKVVKGICGQTEGSVIPDMLGMEAGQSAFGDVYEWYKQLLLWPIKNLCEGPDKEKILNDLSDSLISQLSQAAEKIDDEDTTLIALDWLNGRRTPFADQNLRGAIKGLTIGTEAPAIFKALVESTAFGARKINERFEEEGVPIKGIIALGGVARKSGFVMQTLANILNREIKVARSEQTCALGAAMFASVCAGIHPDIFSAQKAMSSGFDLEFKPEKHRVDYYNKKYNEYSAFSQYIEQTSDKPNLEKVELGLKEPNHS